MKITKVILCAVCAVLLFASCAAQTPESSGGDKLKVCASFYTLYDFAQKIGGDKAEVQSLAPSGTEPHDFEPATSDLVKLEKTDVFIYNGAGLENWVDRVLSALQNKKLVAVEASKGISLLSGDAHVWLNPQYAKTEMQNIKDAMSKADPANAAVYEQNYNNYAVRLDSLDQKYRETLAACPRKDIVVAHEAFGYLCAAYGLRQVGIEGLQADSEPSPARMAEIIQFVKANGVKVIFSEELLSPRVAEAIARETGASTEVLNPLEGLAAGTAGGEDYFSVMTANLEKLKKALS